jgi:hypothetical protein
MPSCTAAIQASHVTRRRVLAIPMVATVVVVRTVMAAMVGTAVVMVAAAVTEVSGRSAADVAGRPLAGAGGRGVSGGSAAGRADSHLGRVHGVSLVPRDALRTLVDLAKLGPQS